MQPESIKIGRELTMPEEIIKTTCARDCYDACGIAVFKEDGVITKVLGDPDHAISRGKLCGKCAIAYNGAWRDARLRLARPLRRAGAKGTRTFVEISWDEALAEIAKCFRELIDAGEARTIVQTHYTGTVGLIGGSFPLRLFNRMGATEVDPDTVCNKAGHLALALAFGNSLEGCAARTALIRGANPAQPAPHQDNVLVIPATHARANIVCDATLGRAGPSAPDI